MLELQSDRKGYLRQYLLACVRQNIFSWGDLLELDALERVWNTLLRDATEVTAGLVAEGGLKALGAAGVSAEGAARVIGAVGAVAMRLAHKRKRKRR